MSSVLYAGKGQGQVIDFSQSLKESVETITCQDDGLYMNDYYVASAIVDSEDLKVLLKAYIS